MRDKYLIVNGDDFGAGRGINRGIIAAYRRGILTSTSLLVNAQWAENAVHVSRKVQDLDIGLHIDLGESKSVLAPDDCRAELERQLLRFRELVGRLPTHLDSHRNAHRNPLLLPHFLDLARQYGLPLREQSPVHYLSKFYGQWGGETHLEQIGVASLVRILEAEVQEGITELSCHPGYLDPEFTSGYARERHVELQTLCASEVRDGLARYSIQLANFRDLAAIVANMLE